MNYHNIVLKQIASVHSSYIHQYARSSNYKMRWEFKWVIFSAGNYKMPCKANLFLDEEKYRKVTSTTSCVHMYLKKNVCAKKHIKCQRIYVVNINLI